MRNPVVAALLASAFLSLSANATDLLQIYQDALANDPQYASARSSLTAGQEKSVQGRAGLLPTIGLNGSDTRSRVESQPDIANADRNFTTSRIPGRLPCRSLCSAGRTGNNTNKVNCLS
jgi:outer membrane protein